jgi:hypothetical protein
MKQGIGGSTWCAYFEFNMLLFYSACVVTAQALFSTNRPENPNGQADTHRRMEKGRRFQVYLCHVEFTQRCCDRTLDLFGNLGEFLE